MFKISISLWLCFIYWNTTAAEEKGETTINSFNQQSKYFLMKPKIVVRMGKEQDKEPECKGWCLVRHMKNMKPLINVIPKLSNITTIKTLGQKLFSLVSIIQNKPYFLVRSDMSQFANKGSYTDRFSRSGHQISRRSNNYGTAKNIMKVPSEIFYPYTRKGIRDILDKNGHYYKPLNYIKRRSVGIEKTDTTSSSEPFSNNLFEVNPRLYSDNLNLLNNVNKGSRAMPTNVVDNISTQSNTEEDESMDLYDTRRSSKSAGGTNLKWVDLNTFLGRDKSCAGVIKSVTDLQNVIGKSNAETVFETPNNEVDDVVVAMRTRKNARSIGLIFGLTKTAVTIIKSLLKLASPIFSLFTSPGGSSPGNPSPGYPPPGYPPTGYPPPGYPPPGYPPPGYPPPGYPPPEYPSPGYPSPEYPPSGYPLPGNPSTGNSLLRNPSPGNTSPGNTRPGSYSPATSSPRNSLLGNASPGNSSSGNSILETVIGLGKQLFGKQRSAPIETNAGLLLEGDSRKKVIDNLLRSMLTNYQYNSKNAPPKRFMCHGYPPQCTFN